MSRFTDRISSRGSSFPASRFGPKYWRPFRYLAYNFLTFLPRDVYRETTFYHFLGSLINLTPLGKGFDYFFLIFILLPVCATLSDLYGRAKNIVGFGILDGDDKDAPPGFGAGGWREGRELIERELNGTSRLGLATPRKARVSLDNSGRSTSTGTSGRSNTPSSTTYTAHQQPARSDSAQRQAQRLADATQAAEEEDENAFLGFAHRVRYTFDAVERPEWLPDLGKRPKWMGGVDGSGQGSGRADSGRGMGRWFGGRPADGRLRL